MRDPKNRLKRNYHPQNFHLFLNCAAPWTSPNPRLNWQQQRQQHLHFPLDEAKKFSFPPPFGSLSSWSSRASSGVRSQFLVRAGKLPRSFLCLPFALTLQLVPVISWLNSRRKELYQYRYSQACPMISAAMVAGQKCKKKFSLSE